MSAPRICHCKTGTASTRLKSPPRLLPVGGDDCLRGVLSETCQASTSCRTVQAQPLGVWASRPRVPVRPDNKASW